MTSRARSLREFLVVVVLTCLAPLVVWLANGATSASLTPLVAALIAIARVAFAAPLMLYIPGFALLALLRVDSQPTIVETVVWRCGASLVIVVLSGLLLNLTPPGLSLAPWLLLLSVFSLAALAGSLLRNGAFMLTGAPPAEMANRPFPFISILVLALAIIIATGAVALSASGAQKQAQTAYSVLWMVPQNASVTDVTIGVENRESSTMTYAITVVDDNTVLVTWKDIVVQPGHSWTRSLSLPASALIAGRCVDARMYRAGDLNHIYRHASVCGPLATTGQGA